MKRSAREKVDRRTMLKASAAAAVAIPSGTAEAGEIPPEVREGIRRGRRYRLRELGVVIGELPTGRYNAITDVPGVAVGYRTVIFDRPGPPPNIARTGVTVIVPRDEPVWRNHCYAGIHAHNGNGELTGAHWIAESGWLTSNIGITNTHQVGIVRDTLVKLEAERNKALTWRLPVVAETWDGPLNQMDGFWITEDHVRAAVADAKGGLPAEGNVGGGTGMSFFGYKGGSGTSSRRVDHHGNAYTVGVFAQTNFGRPRDLLVKGAPVGAELPPPPSPAPEKSQGSCIVVIATDAPLLPGQCRRLAERAGIGLGLVGGVASNGDGDIYLAFSTGNDIRPGEPAPLREAKAIDNDEIDPFFHAVVEATQEALLNSATKAERMTGNLGTREALPLPELVGILQRHRLYP
ncbi:P1 family peptidase [Amycolatopsis sp. NPDC059027]|uniref:P1 family peptidase n=1 Tax=unclassified Amycolatopsis TaxID=2618356 RepID=UPI00366D197F